MGTSIAAYPHYYACCSMRGGPFKCRSLALYAGQRCPESYMFMHEVAPSAVTMAVATDAMICTMNLNVSLLLMVFSFFLFWHGFHGLSRIF